MFHSFIIMFHIKKKWMGGWGGALRGEVCHSGVVRAVDCGEEVAAHRLKNSLCSPCSKWVT